MDAEEQALLESIQQNYGLGPDEAQQLLYSITGGGGGGDALAPEPLESEPIGSESPIVGLPDVHSQMPKAGKTEGGILGALETGMDTLGDVAPILGGMAEAGAKANQARDQILPQAENAKLARDKFALDAPTTRMDQSMRASLIKSASPTKVNWGGPGSGLRGEVPSFSGGFSGALANIDPRSRQLADAVLTQDLQDQLSGKDKNLDYLADMGKTSTMDKIVGGASTAASIWNALKQRSPYNTPRS